MSDDTTAFNAERLMSPGRFTRGFAHCMAVLLEALVVSASANTSQQNADTAFMARAVIIGQSRAEILACAGKPERAAVNGDAETLVYTASSGESTLMVGAGNTLLSNVRHSCEVTLVLRRGYVEDVLYSGRTGGTLTPDEECAPIVSKCMSPR